MGEQCDAIQNLIPHSIQNFAICAMYIPWDPPLVLHVLTSWRPACSRSLPHMHVQRWDLARIWTSNHPDRRTKKNYFTIWCSICLPQVSSTWVCHISCKYPKCQVLTNNFWTHALSYLRRFLVLLSMSITRKSQFFSLLITVVDKEACILID